MLTWSIALSHIRARVVFIESSAFFDSIHMNGKIKHKFYYKWESGLFLDKKDVFKVSFCLKLQCSSY